MVRIQKISNNGIVTVATDCVNADEFTGQVADATIKYIEATCDLGGPAWPADLGHDLPQIIEGTHEILSVLRCLLFKARTRGLLHSGTELPKIEESYRCVEQT